MLSDPAHTWSYYFTSVSNNVKKNPLRLYRFFIITNVVVWWFLSCLRHFHIPQFRCLLSLFFIYKPIIYRKILWYKETGVQDGVSFVYSFFVSFLIILLLFFVAVVVLTILFLSHVVTKWKVKVIKLKISIKTIINCFSVWAVLVRFWIRLISSLSPSPSS